MTIVFIVLIVLVIFGIFYNDKEKKITKELQKPFPEGSKDMPVYYMFVDVETTGLLPSNINFQNNISSFPLIVQIAWMLFDAGGGYIRSENFIIKQDKEVPKSAVKIHGITKKRSIQEGVEFDEMINTFLEDYKKASVISAHNARFDILTIQGELIRNGINFILNGKTVHCTMLNTTNYCRLKKTTMHSGYKWPKLEELVAKVYLDDPKINFKLIGAHNAYNDVWATAKCYFILLHRNFKFKDNSKVIWENVRFHKYLNDLKREMGIREIPKLKSKVQTPSSKKSGCIVYFVTIALIIIILSLLNTEREMTDVNEGNVYYTTSRLNVRSEPSLNSNIITVLDKEMRVEITDSVINNFVLISYDNKKKDGWVSVIYLKK